MGNKTFAISNFDIAKQQLLIWGSRFSSCCFLDNHQYPSALQQKECLLAAGERFAVKANAGTAFKELNDFIASHKGQWIFGHLSYDLKAETESIPSTHADETGFPDLYFFVPETVIQLQLSEITITTYDADPETIWDLISHIQIPPSYSVDPGNIQPRIDREGYLETIDKLRAHILRGDCYEINYCQEFFAENYSIDPVAIYQQLSTVSPNPFSCYYRVNNSHLVCASPERYLMKKGNRIVSQPIKGTSPRNLDDLQEDAINKAHLQTNSKERSENVMVVDLVRNDLSRICREGSVKVEELFGVYSYPNVHQMISTVSGELKDGIGFTEIISATFPMGSMTGAPKKRVVELIEKYEPFRRGIFSGSVGYISPEEDFDFNVVIRSILYNAEKKRLSYMAGSGITWYSVPAKEYEECMLKAAGIKKVLAVGT